MDYWACSPLTIKLIRLALPALVLILYLVSQF